MDGCLMTIWEPNDLPYATFVNQQANGIRDVATLFELLTYIRLAKTADEASFVDQLIKLLPDSTTQDRYGNILVTVGDAPAQRVFSCHTDMVSFDQDSSRQKLVINDIGFVYCADANQLGADDGAGIWLMLNMIAADIPGCYIFHRDEEIGGLGSMHIKYYQPELLDGIQQAIAFDRRDNYSIITHMQYQQCCNPRFARALAKALGMAHRLDETGGFTDVTHYIYLIPECTNISVGYLDEHTVCEQLDYIYLLSLRDKLLAVDWQAQAIISVDKPSVLNTETIRSFLRHKIRF
jgi:hypothetical protein